MTVIDAASVEAIARRVAALLQSQDVSATGLVDAAEIARQFGVSRDYVYDNAERLGAVRLGDGPRGRLRFDPIVVAERIGAPAATSPPPTTRTTRRRGSSGAVALLPIKGRGR